MNGTEYYKSPHINLTGAVDEEMIEDLDRQIKLTDPKVESVIVTLTSGGGSVGFARAIYEELQLLQSRVDATLVARGICLSSAVTIAMAFPKKRRLATPNTKFLIHEGALYGDPRIGGPLSARKIQMARFRSEFSDDKEEQQWVFGLIAEGCGQPLRKVEKKARKGVWMVGKQALKFGLVSGWVKAEPARG